MPGLFGFISNSNMNQPFTLLEKMADALKHEKWHEVNLFHNDGIGLGRISTGKNQSGSQPVWNGDKTRCVFIEGEIFNREEIAMTLTSRGRKLKSNNDAELILNLFEEMGSNFPEILDGAFTIAIWDNESRNLILANDQLGLRPLYYSKYGEMFSFASNVHGLLADGNFPRKNNAVAIAQMLSFEHVLGNETLLENVFCLPPASILTYTNHSVIVRSYYQLQFKDPGTYHGEEYYIEGFLYNLRKAIVSQQTTNYPYGLNLSGGIDSRILLALLIERTGESPVQTFTFGIPGCNDIQFAHEIAKIAKVDHQIQILDPNYLIYYANKGIWLTDGMESCVHMHAYSQVKNQSNYIKVLYTGFLIDTLAYVNLKRHLWTNYSDDTAIQVNLEILNKIDLFPPPDKNNLLTPDFKKLVNEKFYETFRESMLSCKSSQFVDWQNNHELLNRQRRFTNNGNEILRNELIVRTPFANKEFVDFSLQLPSALRQDHYLMNKVLAKLNYDFAKVPYANTGYPLVPCLRELGIRINQQLRWQMKKIGLNFEEVPKIIPYTNYELWFRQDLRDWVEQILLDKNMLSHEYFTPEGIKNIIKEHMAGENQATKLGLLLTIELWLRQVQNYN